MSASPVATEKGPEPQKVSPKEPPKTTGLSTGPDPAITLAR